MKILLVDDKVGKIQKIMKVIMEVEGINQDMIDYSVEANDARQKLQRSTYDLLILDLNMPECLVEEADENAGATLVDEILEIEYYKKPTEIVVLSAYDECEEDFIKESNRTGFTMLRYDESSVVWSIKLKAILEYRLLYSQQNKVHENIEFAIISTVPVETEAVKKLSVKPPYNDAERELDQYYRLHCTLRLTRYFQPLYTHLDIEQRISRCIRQGYVTRNPFSPEYVQRIRKCNEAAKEHGFEKVDFRDVRSTAMGFTMIGMSGVGKTTAVDRILSMYPQYITHTKYKNKPFCMKQIVWMKLDCPFDGSIKGL